MQLARSAHGLRGADLAALASRAGATPAATGAGDVVTRLERLERLRASGAISEAELERLKAQVIGGAR